MNRRNVLSLFGKAAVSTAVIASDIDLAKAFGITSPGHPMNPGNGGHPMFHTNPNHNRNGWPSKTTGQEDVDWTGTDRRGWTAIGSIVGAILFAGGINYFAPRWMSAYDKRRNAPENKL